MRRGNQLGPLRKSVCSHIGLDRLVDNMYIKGKKALNPMNLILVKVCIGIPVYEELMISIYSSSLAQNIRE